ncbi:MAG: zinc-binding dehydrogenase [Candidatus Latescibacterota bacterium]|nr:zinc-binding dehydrogenase [Candidatus Latescibacterota bacterium]
MTPSSATAIVFDGPGAPLRPQTLPLPETGQGEMLVALDLATVCGSDLHTVEGRRSELTPSVLGHEGVGRVVALGEGPHAVPSLREGDRVTFSIAASCGRCDACTRWQLPQKCDRLFKYGHARLDDGCGLNGTYASHLLLRAGTTVIPVPDALDDRIVASANCALATAVCAVNQVPVGADNALVQGAGLLGLYTCALLRERGLSRVFCVDPLPGRRKLAEHFGATPVDGTLPASDRIATLLDEVPSGVDAAFEMSGDSAVVPEAIEVQRFGATYVLVGTVHPDSPLDITGEQIVRRCLRVCGVHNYAPEHLRQGVAFLEATRDRYPFNELVSPPIALTRLQEAIELSQQRRWLRVAVSPHLES